jgi:hypothetical protein
LQAQGANRDEWTMGNLLSKDEFKRAFTDNGIVYHGTPNLESAMAIMRKGLFISSEAQGHAYFGYGAYSSKNLTTADTYAGPEGLVLELKIKENAKILDWKKFIAENAELVKSLEKEAAEQGRDIFRFISQKYNIDVIINNHILIQNANMVSYPQGLESLLNSLLRNVNKTDARLLDRLRSLLEYQKLFQFMQDLGEEPKPASIDLVSLLQKFSKVISRNWRFASNPRLAPHEEIKIFSHLYLQLNDIEKAKVPWPSNLSAIIRSLHELIVKSTYLKRNLRILQEIEDNIKASGKAVKTLSSAQLQLAFGGLKGHDRLREAEDILSYLKKNGQQDYIKVREYFIGILIKGFFDRRNGKLYVFSLTKKILGLSIDFQAHLLSRIFRNTSEEIAPLKDSLSDALTSGKYISRQQIILLIDQLIEAEMSDSAQAFVARFLFWTRDESLFQKFITTIKNPNNKLKLGKVLGVDFKSSLSTIFSIAEDTEALRRFKLNLVCQHMGIFGDLNSDYNITDYLNSILRDSNEEDEVLIRKTLLYSKDPTIVRENLKIIFSYEKDLSINATYFLSVADNIDKSIISDLLSDKKEYGPNELKAFAVWSRKSVNYIQLSKEQLEALTLERSKRRSENCSQLIQDLLI